MAVFNDNNLEIDYEQDVEAVITLEEAVLICAALGSASNSSVKAELNKDEIYGSRIIKDVPESLSLLRLYTDFRDLLVSKGVINHELHG